MKKVLILACLILCSGCANRTVYVPNGSAVKLRENIKNAKVWVQTDKGSEPGTMTLPEGWYCLPDED